MVFVSLRKDLSAEASDKRGCRADSRTLTYGFRSRSAHSFDFRIKKVAKMPLTVMAGSIT